MSSGRRSAPACLDFPTKYPSSSLRLRGFPSPPSKGSCGIIWVGAGPPGRERFVGGPSTWSLWWFCSPEPYAVHPVLGQDFQRRAFKRPQKKTNNQRGLPSSSFPFGMQSRPSSPNNKHNRPPGLLDGKLGGKTRPDICRFRKGMSSKFPFPSFFFPSFWPSSLSLSEFDSSAENSPSGYPESKMKAKKDQRP